MLYRIYYTNFKVTVKTSFGDYATQYDEKESNRQSHLKCEKEIEKYKKDGCTWDSVNIQKIIV